MRIHTLTALALVLPSLAAAQAPVDVNAVRLGDVKKVVELDMDKLKGQPSQVAWSDDGSQIYVQTLEGTFGMPNNKLRHYIFNVQTGAKEDIPGAPDWARVYWTTKSHHTSPDVASFRIEPKKEVKQAKSTSTPMGGDLARGGVGGETGSSSGDVQAAIANQQQVALVTLVLNGETIGQWENAPMVPGQTFGWGAKGTKAIAYRGKNGALFVMDDKGTKRELADTKDIWFPAWSPNGKQIAWLQKDGKKKYTLLVATIN